MTTLPRILLLGAGLCVPPLVKYLAENGFRVVLASRTLSKAEALAQGLPNVEPVQLDIETPEGAKKLEEIVPTVDGVISMLPYLFHAQAAKVAIANKKHFFTTSYVSPAIKALEESAKEAGVMMLNECGVDPGFDHMSALRVIHDVTAKGGKITSFTSITGGLPAPEDNNNPFGYKLSWAPRGVLLAGLNPAQFLRDGQEVKIPGSELFDNYHTEHIPELNGGTEVEALPNRDSLSYIQTYSIPDVKTMFRGTYRYRGWCATVRKLISFGLINIEERTFPEGFTYADLVREKIGADASADIKTALKAAIEKIPPARAEPEGSEYAKAEKIISNMEWLGLLSNEVIPAGTKTSLDAVCHLAQRKLVYAPGEKDMILMRHTFTAEYPDKTEHITATMIDFGIPNGHSSMSRTVALPLAIAIKLLYTGKVKFQPGVFTPIYPELYNPILDELEKSHNIKIIEKRT